MASSIQGAAIYGNAWPNSQNAAQQPATQVASGGSVPVNPFITTTWIGVLIVLIAIRVINDILD